MVLGEFLLVSAVALLSVGLLLTSRGSEQRRIARVPHGDAAELAGPLVQTRLATSSHRDDAANRRRRATLRRAPGDLAPRPPPSPLERLPRLNRPARSTAGTPARRTDRTDPVHGGRAAKTSPSGPRTGSGV